MRPFEIENFPEAGSGEHQQPNGGDDARNRPCEFDLGQHGAEAPELVAGQEPLHRALGESFHMAARVRAV